MGPYVTGTGQVLAGIHSIEVCRPGPCTIHNPSDHHMRDWPTHWREDRRIMERICPHGVGHPDPDGLVPPGDDRTHGCDGCCMGHDGYQFVQGLIPDASDGR